MPEKVEYVSLIGLLFFTRRLYITEAFLRQLLHSVIIFTQKELEIHTIHMQTQTHTQEYTHTKRIYTHTQAQLTRQKYNALT